MTTDTTRIGPGSERPSLSRAPSFFPGDVLGERYRVTRFIARGGMGEVYEVEDLELKERVALKAMRPELSLDSDTKARFRREISLARKITHPHICRVFEFGFHRLTDPPREVAFLTMEFLAGETLEARLMRRGKMTEDEALPLVIQMAGALEAAHNAGVVHRDFKSANVMLVPGPHGRLRAVVTDFGLALGQAGHHTGNASVTLAGMVVGTPAYMAPEQAEGDPATPLSDVYSLGVVMYELVCGVRPHQGNSPITLLAKRLRDLPSSPRLYTPELGTRWETAILGCLAVSPSDRIPKASEIPRILTGESGHRLSLAMASRTGFLGWISRKGPLRWIAFVATAAALLVASAFLIRATRRPAQDPPPASAVARRQAVAVLGFRNLSGRPEAEWFATAFTEMLAAELSGGERLRTIPGEEVARLKMELGAGIAESPGQETLEKVRANLAADFAITGAYLAIGGKGGGVRLDLRVHDLSKRETLATLTETGSEATLFELVARAGAGLRARLGVLELSAGERESVKAALPAGGDATRLYAEGLGRLRVLDSLGAVRALERAVERDPAFPLSRAALAQSYAALGYDARAKAAAKKAFDLSERLSREDRLSVEARYHEVAGEWDKAVEIHRLLFGFFPDHVDYGLRLAEAEISAGRPEATSKTLALLRALPPPASTDPRLELVEARAALAVSDYPRALTAAREAGRKGQALGARLLVAKARLIEGDALLNTGEVEAAVALFTECQRIQEQAGDPTGAAQSMAAIANAAWTRGDLPQARDLYEKVLALARSVGNEGGAARALQGRGKVLSDMGELGRAETDFDEADRIYKETGDMSGSTSILVNRALTRIDQGKLTAAGPLLDEALRVKKQSGDKRGVARVLNMQGEVLRLRGDPRAAEEVYLTGLGICQEIGQKGLAAVIRTNLAKAALDAGDLERAGRELAKALQERAEIKQQVGGAETRLVLARLLLVQGRPKEAEFEASEAYEAFQRGNVAHLAGAALALRAQALAELSRGGEARAALLASQPYAERSQYFEVQKRIGLSKCAVLLTLGRIDEARKVAAGVREGAEAVTAAGLALEASRWVAMCDLASGNAAEARRALITVAKEARRRGLLQIAREAEAGLLPKRG